MAERSRDWIAQARADLDHARHSVAAGDFEWACFAAQQAAEKALKGLLIACSEESWGHSLLALAGRLPSSVALPEELIDSCKVLDKFYIATRYPNAFAAGKPKDYFRRGEAEDAIRRAVGIVDYCSNQVGASS